MKVQVTQDVSEAQILNSLINWSDSGIANFYVEHIDHRPYRMDGDDDYLNLPVVVTLQEDCEVDGKLEFVLDQDAIERGVAALAKLYPRVFAQEFPADPDAYNGDASTADLFVQCCLFGKEVFG